MGVKESRKDYTGEQSEVKGKREENEASKRENQRRKQLVSWPWIKKLQGRATAVRTKTKLSASARASLRERADIFALTLRWL